MTSLGHPHGAGDLPDWNALAHQIRLRLGDSQGQFAARLATCQATISRWETRKTAPSPKYRAALRMLVAATGGAASPEREELRAAVRASPFAMILVDRDGAVVAASTSSGFREGQTVLEQTPAAERANFARFRAALRDEGFWEGRGGHRTYRFHAQGESRGALVSRVTVPHGVYALVQRL